MENDGRWTVHFSEVSGELRSALEARAKQNRRSIGNEILSMLISLLAEESVTV
jgi:hypothetical protein